MELVIRHGGETIFRIDDKVLLPTEDRERAVVFYLLTMGLAFLAGVDPQALSSVSEGELPDPTGPNIVRLVDRR